MTTLKLVQMSPRDIQAAVQALKAEIGPKADIYPSIHIGAHPIYMSVYANGIAGNLTFSVDADEWPEAFALARERWAEVRDRHEITIIERMALEIIRVTHRKGECSDADIRDAKFSNEEVAHYGASAIEQANAMAEGGPFSIYSAGKANAA